VVVAASGGVILDGVGVVVHGVLGVVGIAVVILRDGVESGSLAASALAA